MSRKLILSIFVLIICSLTLPSHTKTTATQIPQVRHQEITLNLSSSGTIVERAGQATTIITDETEVLLKNPAPFLAVAIRVGGINEPIDISYRITNDTTWSEWDPVTIDRDASPQGSDYLSSLLILDKETRRIQFKLSLDNNNTFTGTEPSSFRVNFISPGASSENSLASREVSPGGNRSTPESSNANYPKPVVISRTDWGCPDGQGNPRGAPGYTTVTHLIVHHTANANTATDWPAIVRSIWNFHIFTNGWSDIGYNYLIDPNGIIYEGRGGGDNVLGAHFSCQNGGTMGVALLGTFTTVRPTDAALNSVKEILSWKADQRDIDPSAASFHAGMQQTLQNISGHRDGNNLTRSCTVTECPGDLFYPLFPSLRAEVKGLVNPTNDFSLTTSTTKQVTARGGVVTFPISTNTLAGSSQSISLSLRNLPAQISSSFTVPTVVTCNSTQLSLTIPDTVPSGNYVLTVIGSGATKRALDLTLTVTGRTETVSAASYLKASPIAIESIVSAFGANLSLSTKAATEFPLPTSLADVTVKVKDSLNNEVFAPLFYVSPTQINYQIPVGLAPGNATVTISSLSEITALGTINLARVAPGIFTANASGQGVAAAQLQRRKADGSDSFEPVAVYDDAQKLFFPRLLDLSPPNEQYFLLLYGTGIRFRNLAAEVTAQIGGTPVEVLYAGEQREFFGLDQLNLRLPPNLMGRGQLELQVTVDGQRANPVTLAFK